MTSKIQFNEIPRQIKHIEIKIDCFGDWIVGNKQLSFFSHVFWQVSCSSLKLGDYNVNKIKFLDKKLKLKGSKCNKKFYELQCEQNIFYG